MKAASIAVASLLIGCGGGADTFGPPQWSISFGDPEYDFAAATAFATNDDVLVGGYFARPTDFGSGTIDPGAQGCFLTRRAALNGAERWTATIVTDSCGLWGLAGTPDGGVVATGRVTGAVDFGGVIVDVPEAHASFVVSYDADGGLRWVYTLPPTSHSEGTAIAVGADGTVYTGGGFTGVLDLGDGPVQPCGGATLECPINNGYVLVLSPDGELIRGRIFEADGFSHLRSVAVGPDGGLAVALTLGAAITVDGETIAPRGYSNAVTVRFAPDGALAWTRVFGPEGDRVGPAGPIAFDPEGRIVHLASPGDVEGVLHLRVLGTDGADVWDRADDDDLDGRTLAIAPDGTIIKGGRTGQAIIGGGDMLGMFLAAYDSDGDPLERFSYASNATSPDDEVTALAASPNDRLALAARYFGTLDLGNGPLAPGIVVAVLGL